MNYLAILELLIVSGICCLIVLKRTKRPADWWLLVFFLILAINDLFNVLHPHTELHWVHLVTISLCPAVFRFHLFTLFQQPLDNKRLVYLVPFALLVPMILVESVHPGSFIFRFYLFAVILILILHGVIALVSMRHAGDGASSPVKQWALWFGWSYCLFFSFSLIGGMAVDDSSTNQVNIFEVCNDALSLFTILLISYVGYRFGILYPPAEDKPQSSQQEEKMESHQKLFEKVDSLIDEEQLYLKSDLTISALCKRLSVNQKYMSQAINICYGSGFNQYINEKRIAAFESKIKHVKFKNYSIAALSHECGFRSSTSFNRIFKTIKGITPSEYRESLMAN